MRRKIIITLLIAVFIAIPAIILVMDLSSRNGKVAVLVTMAPADSNLNVDGRNVKHGDIVYLKPGSYNYVATRDFFIQRNESVKISEIENNIIVSLSPEGLEGNRIYEGKRNDYIFLEGIAGKVAMEKGSSLRKDNPLIQRLPYSNMLFKIGYKSASQSDDDKSIIITIHASQAYQNAAIVQISTWGYNPEEYNIEVIGEENPFNE